jgi:hypothetical protein
MFTTPGSRISGVVSLIDGQWAVAPVGSRSREGRKAKERMDVGFLCDLCTFATAVFA